jgi:hypothetical protein
VVPKATKKITLDGDFPTRQKSIEAFAESIMPRCPESENMEGRKDFSVNFYRARDNEIFFLHSSI